MRRSRAEYFRFRGCHTRAVLAPKEVAQILGVSVRTVQYWIASGRLPALKLSPRGTRVPLDAVDDLLRAASRPPFVRGSPDLVPVLLDATTAPAYEEENLPLLIRRALMTDHTSQAAWLFRRYPREAVIDVVRNDPGLPRKFAGIWRDILGLE